MFLSLNSWIHFAMLSNQCYIVLCFYYVLVIIITLLFLNVLYQKNLKWYRNNETICNYKLFNDEIILIKSLNKRRKCNHIIIQCINFIYCTFIMYPRTCTIFTLCPVDGAIIIRIILLKTNSAKHDIFSYCIQLYTYRYVSYLQ